MRLAVGEFWDSPAFTHPRRSAGPVCSPSAVWNSLERDIRGGAKQTLTASAIWGERSRAAHSLETLSALLANVAHHRPVQGGRKLALHGSGSAGHLSRRWQPPLKFFNPRGGGLDELHVEFKRRQASAVRLDSRLGLLMTLV